MPDRSRISLCALMAICAVLFFSARAHSASGGNTVNSCVRCHAQLPGSSFVGARSHSWKGSVHQRHEVTCDKCHGGNPGAAEEKDAHAGVFGSADPRSAVYYKNIPSTCGKCHGAEFYKFTQSLHYKRLESTGKGPECVTCHGSMTTRILTPDTISAVCEQCHNDRLGIYPFIPQKAKAVLLLLQESKSLLETQQKLHHPAEGTAKARHMRDARAALHSAVLDWHKFDLDTITGHLQEMYSSLEALSGGNRH